VVGIPIALLPLLLTAGPTKLAVMDIQARDGVTPGLVQIVTDAVVTEVRKRAHGMTVISSEDMRSLLGLQAQKQRLGCQDMACLAELGGALGVDEMLVGSLAKLGTSTILNLRHIDTRHAKVLADTSERLKGKADEDLLDAAVRAVATLFPDIPAPGALPVSGPELTTAPAKSHPRPLALVLGGAAVVAGAFAVVGLVEVLTFKGWQGQPPGSISLSAAQGQVTNGNTWATVGLITGIAAVAALGGAVIAW
jgi:hypothetical protein